jgi:hypothetical protein
MILDVLKSLLKNEAIIHKTVIRDGKPEKVSTSSKPGYKIVKNEDGSEEEIKMSFEEKLKRDRSSRKPPLTPAQQKLVNDKRAKSINKRNEMEIVSQKRQPVASSKKETIDEDKNWHKPEFFSRTFYSEPTDEQLKDINLSGLSTKDIINGFGYSIIGRGVFGKEPKDTIIKSIERLCNMYPDNEYYKKVLEYYNNKKLHTKNTVDEADVSVEKAYRQM